jgi:hypothetical protein
MKTLTGILVKRVDFSDPQGGKGACDRKAASVKAHKRSRYINEGHNVVSAEGMRDAILYNLGLSGMRVCLLDLADVKTLEPMTIDSISLMNNFKYTDTTLTIWRAYNVGEGKSLDLSKFPGSAISFEMFSLNICLFI